MRTRGRPRHPDVLTPREWEVLTLVREGLTNPQIAERMGITLDAAKYHVSEILSKLHLGSRAEAAAWQPEPPQVPVLRPSWANSLFGWWPLIARVAGAGVVVAAVAGLGVLAYAVITSEREDDSRVGAAAPAAAPSSEAEQIITDGHLNTFEVAESGAVLTIWDTCASGLETDCGYAWRLDTSSETVGSEIVRPPGIQHLVEAYASGDGFLITPATGEDMGILITQDGTASQRSMDCGDATWPTPTEPGRLVWAAGLNFVDTVAGTICPTSRLGGPSLAQGTFAADGALWALADNETGPDTLTIGRYDGVEWRYHDFAADSGSWTSELAAAGSNVVVLLANPEPSPRLDQLVGFAVTTDDGATWSEVLDPKVLERDFPFSTFVDPDPESWFSGYTSMAFAGTSTLYVADGRGDVWRSTDFTTFSQVEVPGDVGDLKSAGDTVIGRNDNRTGCGNCEELVRISADGSVEFITLR